MSRPRSRAMWLTEGAEEPPYALARMRHRCMLWVSSTRRFRLVAARRLRCQLQESILVKPKLLWRLKKLRNHIVWRVFIGIMACIGGITTIASLVEDGIIPVFFPEREAKREIEIKELLRLFTPSPDVANLDWTTGVSLDSPIEWESVERYGEVPDSGFFKQFSAARHGRTVVTIDRKPTHEQFDRSIHPAIWTVSMYGCMAGITCIQFSSEGSGYNEPPNIMAALAEYAELWGQHPESAHTFIGKLYRLAIPGRQESWLVESWSIGNHSWFVELTLFPGSRSRSLAREYLDGLLESPDEVREGGGRT